MTNAGLASTSAAALLVANLETLGVGGVPSRMSTSSELRSAMNSGTPISPPMDENEVSRAGPRPAVDCSFAPGAVTSVARIASVHRAWRSGPGDDGAMTAPFRIRQSVEVTGRSVARRRSW
jgi:hypothetical protein